MLKHPGVRAGLTIVLMMANASSQAGFLQVEHIVQCMQENVVVSGAFRPLTATTRRPDGGERKTGIHLYWRMLDSGDMGLNLQVVSPPDLAGIAYLLRPSDQAVKAWLYLPAMDSVREISADQLTEALWGTEFSYAQFRQLLGVMLTGEAHRLADEEQAGREVYVIDAQPGRKGGGHLAVRSYIDKQSCLLLRAEYFGPDGELHQVLQGDPATLVGTRVASREVWQMSTYTMRNLKSGQETRLEAGDIRLLDGESSSLFSPAHFHERIGPGQ